MIRIQINEFGQVPKQIFKEPHPRKFSNQIRELNPIGNNNNESDNEDNYNIEENKLENNDKIPFSPKINESVISSKSSKSKNSSKSSKSKNSSKSSKSQNNPFLHNYENEVICGSNLKTYTVKNYIGAGSIGIVYSGINNETEEENVAIKIININKNTKIRELTENEI